MHRRRCTQVSPIVRHSSQPFDRCATGFTLFRCLQAMSSSVDPFTVNDATAPQPVDIDRGPDPWKTRAAPVSLTSGRTNERAARAEGARSRRWRGRLGIEGRRAVAGTCGRRADRARQAPRRGLRRRRPWHHARFDLRTGAPTRPGRDPIPCYRVERQNGRVRVGERLAPPRTGRSAGPESAIIVGAGAAGNACAEELRRQGYEGPITMFGSEGTPPVDRPNLSKDYLAGSAPEDWIPLRGREFYTERRIDLLEQVEVTALDVERREVRLSTGRSLRYGALLLATGAEPIRLAFPGADRALTLRTLADSRAIVARAAPGRRAVVIGASFIGMEV